jgi:hypothetical protein
MPASGPARGRKDLGVRGVCGGDSGDGLKPPRGPPATLGLGSTAFGALRVTRARGTAHVFHVKLSLGA